MDIHTDARVQVSGNFPIIAAPPTCTQGTVSYAHFLRALDWLACPHTGDKAMEGLLWLQAKRFGVRLKQRFLAPEAHFNGAMHRLQVQPWSSQVTGPIL
jgi:hypothetical protein